MFVGGPRAQSLFDAGANHVAISSPSYRSAHQNLLENPQAEIQALHPVSGRMWILRGRHKRTEM